MYKIELKVKGKPQPFKCGDMCAISGVSKFFPVKDYLLVPDTYGELFKQYSPVDKEFYHSFPGHIDVKSLEDLNGRTTGDCTSLIAAQVLYLGAMAIERWNDLEGHVLKGNGSVAESVYDGASLIRAMAVISHTGVNNAMERMSNTVASNRLMELEVEIVKLSHAVMCQCGTSWETFETYCGFWHSVFSVVTEAQDVNMVFSIVKLEDTDELPVGDDELPIRAPVLIEATNAAHKN